MSEDDKSQYFLEHVAQEEPCRSWKFGKPRTSAYHFRVTWSPGKLSVSGDIGSAVYEVWPAFSTLAGAIDLVSDANFDYLTGKSNIKEEFDREKTVKSIIQYIYSHLRMGSITLSHTRICNHYMREPDYIWDRKEAFREFMEDTSLSASDIFNITGDFEDTFYSYPSEAHWTYAALKHWVNHMSVKEDYVI